MNRKMTTVAALAATACIALTACGSGAHSADDQSTNAQSDAQMQSGGNHDMSGPITVETNSGEVTVNRPVQRIAALDNRTFEVLEKWGISLVAAPKRLVPSTVTAFSGDDVADIGTHREPNLEALVAAKPDVIISGQRFSQHDEDIAALTQGVPLIDLEPRDDQPFDKELIRQVTTLGKIFGKETEAQSLVDDFTAALDRAKKAYDGTSTVMALNVSGGEIGYVAPHQGRTFGPLFDLLGLKPALEVAGSSDSHTGDDVSVEAIAEANPQWIFVLDRDAAITSQQDSYTPAQSVISENAALANVKAITDKHVLYAPKDTYTNESIITYTEILNSIADAFARANS
ncbi:ABC transporter substrate-binding protein [Schaalia sp. ZJ405]|uniref:siderophore ABC transporter substrate-binding protein n=1 Tax=unclassified Schaalia TaxID=2691889 RepID=UPI0013ED9C56|nr:MULTISPECIES: ABC transporter substrate-binding protein [unclassified Schaalia]QPK81201.1 ABC transporter substrate-binding protein [Schaalia sp. ZJ405]